jgi:hypothetical protein
MQPSLIADRSTSIMPLRACFLRTCIALFTLCLMNIQAQTTSSDEPFKSRLSFRIAAFLETNSIHGDVQDNSAYMKGVKNGLNPGFSMAGSITLLDVTDVFRFSAGARIGYHFINTTADSVLRGESSRLELTNHIVDAALLGEIDVLDLELIRPYIAAGVGYMFFQPKITTTPEVRQQYSYMLDNPERSSLLFPLCFGLKYTPAPRLEVALQYQKLFTLTDNLDGWTSGKNDNLAIFSLGIAYTFGYSKTAVARTVEEERRLRRADSDGDGLSDWDEMIRYSTDPRSEDTDGDGLKDGEELRTFMTDPLQSDTDGDGLTDGDEVHSFKTDPQKKDTDRDGCADGLEINEMHTDPLKADTDGDGLSDCDERTLYSTNPLVRDTDSDGIPDGLEVQRGTDPRRVNK